MPARRSSTTRRTTSRTAASTANATIDEQTLREIYARHFEMVIREGGASSIMASYNLVNTLHATQSQHLLKDILRDDFGFKGFVLSDWWAMPNGSTVPYPGASTLQPTAQQAVRAGLDMELPWRYNYSTLPSLVSANQLMASELVTATARILEQKYRFNADKSSGYLQEGAVLDLRRQLEHREQQPEQPRDRQEPHRPRPAGGRGVDGAAQERQQHAAAQEDGGDEDRRARRQRPVRRPGHHQPGLVPAATCGISPARSTSRPTSAPATSGRAASSPIPARARGRSRAFRWRPAAA